MMDETQQSSVLEAQQQPHEEVITYAGYHSIISGVDRSWDYGGFPLPDGTFWRYREPNAVVVVEADKLRVGVMPLTRANDTVQILDNAKNMFFSTKRFLIPDDGSISFEWNLSARCLDTRPHDLYDGFVSVNLLDFMGGYALDFFVSNDTIATVYARLPFPGVPEPADPEDAVKPRYFSDFNELPIETTEGQTHRYRINYDKGKDEVRYFVDGQEVGVYREVPSKIDSCIIALGLMTEKTIDHGKSASVHGQGLVGEWGPFTITVRKDNL
ncbi:MAG TPA: DUF6081 family protein [Ktedonobacteraceae bacterium]|nr:DUF6081 family protein [Ktedonobacteraceae bacterium]